MVPNRTRERTCNEPRRSACVLVWRSAPWQRRARRSRADDYPQRNVTFLCPFPAGGGTDILTRMLAQELQDKLKRTFIVENRPGAGTIVAAQAAARAAPDGHTIFLAPVTTLALGPNIYKSLPYDTVKDFAPIGLVGSSQFALVANPKLGADTLPELIALIKRKDGQMSFASSGASTPHHLFMEMFLQDDRRQGAARPLSRQRAGAHRRDLRPDPVHDRRSRGRHSGDQRGQGEGITASRRRQRVKAMPDLPTIAEAGVPGYGGRRLVLGGGAGGHAAADHRQAQPGADGLHQPAGDAGQDERARDHAADQHARTSSPA